MCWAIKNFRYVSIDMFRNLKWYCWQWSKLAKRVDRNTDILNFTNCKVFVHLWWRISTIKKTCSLNSRGPLIGNEPLDEFQNSEIKGAWNWHIALQNETDSNSICKSKTACFTTGFIKSIWLKNEASKLDPKLYFSIGASSSGATYIQFTWIHLRQGIEVWCQLRYCLRPWRHSSPNGSQLPVSWPAWPKTENNYPKFLGNHGFWWCFFF